MRVFRAFASLFLDSSAHMCNWEPLEEFLDAVVPATKSKISSSRIVATSCTCATDLTIAWMHNDSVSAAVSTQDTATCVHAGHSNVQDTGLCSLPCPGTLLRNAQQQNSSEKVEPGLPYILRTMHLNREGIEWYRSAAAFKSKMGQ